MTGASSPIYEHRWMTCGLLIPAIPRALDISKALEIAGSLTSGSAMGPPTSTSDSFSVSEEALSHLKLAAECDSVLTTIRTSVPGFENFLMPPHACHYFKISQTQAQSSSSMSTNAAVTPLHSWQVSMSPSISRYLVSERWRLCAQI
ncbi:hypothetical protein FA15DRAFT_711870 [Coprinopsis marcescibilis]|uniref:Uncharacterized protein n=1 Tax=Coprinopsis marcescibilis TaxID=230819 RepID=A0A5C3K8L6_COPMA|nr:hypothetical protein FA15DRAFT_711870 [Coprinopsis marcescibilis]